MLSIQAIKAFYPSQLQSATRFMLREYLQCKILEILFGSNFKNKFCFLGGTCLRLVHENQRFSEDLDFDNFSVTATEFDQMADLIAQGLERQGYEVEFRTVHRGAYHCYIKFPKMLFQQGLSGYETENILIQLDTEAQHFDFQPQIYLLNRFDTVARIFVTPLEIILAQKLYAILNRPRNKGRDFFDVAFLLSLQVKPNYAYLTQKVNISTAQELKQRIATHCESLDFEALAQDVQPFLFNDNDLNKVRWFPELFVQYALE